MMLLEKAEEACPAKNKDSSFKMMLLA